MSFEVKTIPNFEKELKRLAKKYHSLRQEYVSLVLQLKSTPKIGTSLGNNCYKIRISISSKGKGKSGGGRVITYVQLIENTVYLLTIFDKSEQEEIGSHELKLLLSQIP